jgi:hypothetical protein
VILVPIKLKYTLIKINYKLINIDLLKIIKK